MLIVCPSCVSTYRIEPVRLSEAQNTVRCAHCRQLWVVDSAAEPPPPQTREAKRSDGAIVSADLPSIRLDAAISDIRADAEPRVRRLQGRDRRERSAAGLVMLVVMGLGLGSAAVAFRAQVAHFAPAAAVFAAIGLPTDQPGLSLSGVRSAVGEDGGSRILTVEGQIENGRGGSVAVPDLRIVVRDQATQSVYTWITPAPKSALGPGEAVTFQSRLVAPPVEGHDVVVSFADASRASTAQVKDRP